MPQKMLKTSTFLWELGKRHSPAHDWLPKNDNTHRRSGRVSQVSHFTLSKPIQHHNQQSSGGSNGYCCEDVGSVQELARWTLLLLETRGGLAHESYRSYGLETSWCIDMARTDCREHSMPLAGFEPVTICLHDRSKNAQDAKEGRCRERLVKIC